ncbi:uncharacterized protein LOC120353537 [Nilaparvata lugens]|uniref:uncharacterized protein LOC120353537 n=1 Tax=Nilaparvata lugens TaxID=108931 RepID=UPI00193DAD16|nr:uncharacterized protein LOC120353537 [Nilaparvata lugens]
MDVQCVGFIFLVQLAISYQQAPPGPLSPATLNQAAQQHYLQASASNPTQDISKEKRGLTNGVADSVHQGSSSVISVPIHLGRHYPLGVHRSLGVHLPVPVRVTVPRSYPLTVLLDPSAAALEYALGLYSGHYSSSSSLDYNTLLTYLAAARAASHLSSHLSGHLSSSAAHSEHSALANYAALTAAAAAKIV